MEPFDSTLSNKRSMSTKLILSDRLKSDDIDYEVNLNKFHIDLQII